MNAAKSASRLRGLDALRGLAAFAVCLFHYTYSFEERTGQALDLGFSFPYGHYGVDLFFIISGFVIFMTLEKSRHVYDFAAARFSRIYPAYLASLLLATAALSLSDFDAMKPTVAQFVSNLTMMPQVFGQEVVDGVYWTLSYEAAFYIVAATLIRRFSDKRLELFCIIWLGVTLLLRFEPIGLWHYPYALRMVRLFTTGSFAPLFIAGIMLYRICHNRAKPATYAVLAACLLVGLAGPLTAVRPMSGLGYCALISTFALLVWLGGSNRLPLRLIAPLIFLGDISYSFYLLHETIGWIALNRLLAFGVGPWPAFAITLAGAIALAFAVYKLVEKPGQRILRAYFARRRAQLLPEPVIPAVAAE